MDNQHREINRLDGPHPRRGTTDILLMTLRERFERAFGTTSARSTARWNTGTYRDAAVELAWQMWQKGWRWSASNCVEACEAEATIEGTAQRCADACRVVREAL